METRSRYALIGLFMLAVILASFAFVYWLENKGGFGQREVYQILLSGLGLGPAGRLRGPLQRHSRRRGHQPLAFRRRPRPGDRHNRGRSKHTH